MTVGLRRATQLKTQSTAYLLHQRRGTHDRDVGLRDSGGNSLGPRASLSSAQKIASSCWGSYWAHLEYSRRALVSPVL